MQARLRQTCLFAAVATLVVVLAGTTFAKSGNSDVGTWKLNVEKSKSLAGTAPTKSTYLVEVAGAGVKVTVDALSADGTVRHWAFTANYDGKDSPIVGNSSFGDVVNVTRVDANTTKNIYKMGGNVTITQTAVVSGDGKTRTVSLKGTNASGQTLDNVYIYDKQ